MHEPPVVNFERLLDIPITVSKTAANPSRLVSCWNKFGLGFPETLPHWTGPAARKLLAAQAIHETYEQGRRATERKSRTSLGLERPTPKIDDQKEIGTPFGGSKFEQKGLDAV